VSGSAALGIRFAISAALLLAMQALRRGPLLPVRGERAAVFLLGAVGYATESTFFFLGLERGSAAAVGLIFYSYPAMVAGAELALGSARGSRSLVGAVALSIGGTAVVVATGEEVSISRSGVVFALLAAATFTLYFLAGHRFAVRTDAVVNAAWVALGASVSILARGAITGDLHLPGGRGAQLVAYGVANSFAFGCMFAALRRLGPTRAAVLLTFEVVATVVLAALFLDERLRAIQLVGGVAIAAGAVLIARAGVEAAAEPVSEA
jgi:drug/metabolite transporter (DMT)-like permease